MSSFGTPTQLNANIVIGGNQNSCGFHFGASLTPTTKGNGNGFQFGASGGTPTTNGNGTGFYNNGPGFQFGASMTPTTKGNGSGFQFHAVPTTPTTGQGFENRPGFQFGASVTPTNEGNGSGFKFGAPVTPTTKGNGLGFQFSTVPATPTTKGNGQGFQFGNGGNVTPTTKGNGLGFQFSTVPATPTTKGNGQGFQFGNGGNGQGWFKPGAGWSTSPSGGQCLRPFPVSITFGNSTDATQLRRRRERLVGVIVTIFESSSYDELFRRVAPHAGEGEYVEVYALGSFAALSDLRAVLMRPARGTAVPPLPEGWEALARDIRRVPADSVVINFECCGCCGDHEFPGSPTAVPAGSDERHRNSTQLGEQEARRPPPASDAVRLVALAAVQCGFTVLCSDFSLKSLLHEWGSGGVGSEVEFLLGPNPFQRFEQGHSGAFELQFDAAALAADEALPQQLRMVGELCVEAGRATLNAMGSTILFGLKRKRELGREKGGRDEHRDCFRPIVTPRYTLRVLTTAGGACGIADGAVGHALLTYPSGGKLLVSMGHWMELTNINTTPEAVLNVMAEMRCGAEEAASFNQEYLSARSDGERSSCVQRRAALLVQSSSPCVRR